MHIHSAMLWSDWLLWLMAIAGVMAVIFIQRNSHLKEAWSYVFSTKLGMISCIILIFYTMIALLDSIHLQLIYTDKMHIQTASRIVSILDLMMEPAGQDTEKTYSAPFADHLYNPSFTTLSNGKEVQRYVTLKYAQPTRELPGFILSGFLESIVSLSAILVFWHWLLVRKKPLLMKQSIQRLWQGKTILAWREAMLTFSVIWIILGILISLMNAYHVFGTDKIGQDVFYESVKSIRTGLLIGTFTTLFMLPFALILGTFAGYFGGFIDDMIQYLYTTLSSIPGVLLISATILVLQVFIANHSNWFPTLRERADARLLALCFILGITSWASLCRLLRGESLKLREREFIQASKIMGARPLHIIVRHLMPNVMHIVLITLVLDFSGLVLAEAVLSYVGVGVDPTTISWGNMINSSRLELAREPMVWWPLAAAMVFMFILVLSANLFSDKVRDAFDPKLREMRNPT